MTLRCLAPICLLVLAPTTWAQSQPGLSDLVAQAIAASPAVAAELFRVQQATSAADAERSPSNPTVEISPGVGFTNSNFALGQTFDLSGRRAARARRSEAEAQIAVAGLLKAQGTVSEALLSAFAEHMASRELADFAETAVVDALSTFRAMRTRVEIGEAPAVHQTRAEIEVARAAQAQTAARRRFRASTLALHSMLGSELPPGLEWTIPQAQPFRSVRPEVLEAQAQVEAAKARALEAGRLGRPSLFAGIASDVWSLDRRPFQGDTVGFQLQLSMPLWDRGENRHARRAAEAATRAREADLEEVLRRIGWELETARVGLSAVREVAEAYRDAMLPTAQQMVEAMRAGMEAGLTSFVELLEAQRTLNELQREAVEATLALRLAEVQHLAAAGLLPGVGVKK